MSSFIRHLVDTAPQSRLGQSGAAAISFAGRGGVVATQHTLDDLLQRSAGIASSIVSEIKADRVALAFPTGIDFVSTFLACLMAGKLAVPIPTPRHGPQSQRIATILANAQTEDVICQSADLAVFADMVSAGGAGAMRSWAVEDLSRSGQATDIEALPGFDRPASDLVFLQYTSGSTQDPTGVGISNGNALDNAAKAKRAYLMGSEQFVNWMPHFHDMGLVGGILIPLALGMPSVQMAPFSFLQRPVDLLKLIASLPEVVCGGPAFSLNILMDRVPRDVADELDLSSWRRLFCGGEPIPAGLFDRFRAHFRNAGFRPEALYATYGMAETTLYAAGGYVPEPLSAGAELFEACSLSLEDQSHLCIVDPDSGESVAQGDTGEIWMTGASIGQVFKAGEAAGTTGQGELNGRRYHRTGDLGKIIGDRLYVTGRIKDVLIINGQNIMASEVEWAAAELSDALNPLAAAAYQMDDDQSCYLEIELRGKAEAGADHSALTTRMHARLASQFGIDFKQICIRKRGSLPRTSSGKIQRSRVKQDRGAPRLESAHD
ncbi:AMP-binding protein [Maricaulis sp.]|uniref:AMP-binding protein n=1 Tax=Maricaulis sp. TaxID=1486257 RepID=UPI00260A425A|nr:AMP-binding protein [Maricaulis sp.]